MKLVHLIPDRLVHPDSYTYRMDGPNEECDVSPKEAAELIAGGAFHDVATLDWPPPALPETSPETPPDGGVLDSAAIEPAGKE